MTALLEDAYDLTVVSVGLVLGADEDGSATEPMVGIAVETDGTAALQLAVTMDDMQLPETLAAVANNLGVYRARLPDAVLEMIADSVSSIRPGEPVWLRLAPPSGHLPCVPWERLLQPALGVPVLRLPASAVTPVASTMPLQVAICAPEPRDGAQRYDVGAQLERLVSAASAAVPGDTHIHVFTNSAAARERIRGHAPTTVMVHEPMPEPPPERYPDVGEVRLGLPGRVQNPWLRWIVKALGGGSVDVMHFACPGYLSATYGALDFGRSPNEDCDERTASLVSAGELMAFLARVGAWAVGYTIPDRTGWPAGIRLLAHRAAQINPGPVIVDAPHYTPEDEADALGDAYRLLFSPTGASPPSTPACSIYVNPGRVREALGHSPGPAVALFESELHRRIGSLTLESDPSDALLGGKSDPPAWLAANQRTLERWASVVLESEATGRHREAVVQGLNDALEIVAEVLARHARSREGGT